MGGKSKPSHRRWMDSYRQETHGSGTLPLPDAACSFHLGVAVNGCIYAYGAHVFPDLAFGLISLLHHGVSLLGILGNAADAPIDGSR